MQGIGVDIVEIARIEGILSSKGSAFTKRIFTLEEIKYCLQSEKLAPSRFAARFAGKEAVAKALGVGIGKKLGWQDITISMNPQGKPEVKLSEKAGKAFGSPKILISLSHEKSYAVATAIAF